MDILRSEHTLIRRGDDFILGPIDLSLAPGEILGVVGPRAAGKSTLMRLIWGFLRPEQGRLQVFGRTPHLEQVRVRRHAGYMTGSPEFYGRMTGTRFLELMAGFYPTWNWERARQVANMFSLDLDREVARLSEDDRARLGLVGALTHRPGLLILDEPTAGLAPSARDRILDLLRHIATTERTGIVLSAGGPDGLDRVADTMIVLHAGEVVGRAPSPIPPERYGRATLEQVLRRTLTRGGDANLPNRS
jgi:ABC-2 type transport system ATP-binding protein